MNKFIAVLFSMSLALAFLPAGAEETPKDPSGSPYRDLADLETGEILHLPTGVTVTEKQLIDSLEGSRVIYIGETHDNLEAHRVQLEIIQRINERYPGKVAVGMEMFRRSAQSSLDAWQKGQLDDRSFRKLFRKNWGMGYKLYGPIFEYLKRHQLPIVALKSNTDIEQIMRDKGPGQAEFPEIDFEDPFHKAYSMSLFGANADHMEAAAKPYRMLLLWEETMAETVARFLRNPDNKDRKLIVLAGGFHVQYGFGIPKRAFRRVPHPYSIVLPTVTEVPEELSDRRMNVGSVSIPLYSADFAWKLDYVVLKDSGIKLGVMLEELETGLLVKQVMPGSNAEGLKILEGDVILYFDGHPLLDLEDLRDHLQKKQEGESATLKLLRNGEEVTVQNTLHASTPHPKH